MFSFPAMTSHIIQNGVSARSPELRLTGHGMDREEAVEALQRGIVAWCDSLNRAGILESTLKRLGVKWEPEGEGIQVKLGSVQSPMGVG